MNVNVKQQRVTEGNADDRSRICQPQGKVPLHVLHAKQTAQRDNQIAPVPSHHAHAERQQQMLNRDHTEPLPEQEISHPDRQHGA
jgi:hypothetical protein